MKGQTKILVTLAATMLTAPANAVLINSSGFWNNVAPPNATNLQGVGTSTLSWGTPVPDGTQSSYNFTGVGGLDIGPLPAKNRSLAFAIGLFTHDNQPIFGIPITQTTLNIGLDIFNGSVFSGVFQFVFDHNETINLSPCANPASVSVCDDEVSIMGGLAQTFNVDGSSFRFDIFFIGGSLMFLTQEGLTNTRGLIGVITNIPEPGTILLLGVGLVGLGLSRKRRRSI